MPGRDSLDPQSRLKARASQVQVLEAGLTETEQRRQP
jgi:hypothetical protein